VVGGSEGLGFVWYGGLAEAVEFGEGLAALAFGGGEVAFEADRFGGGGEGGAGGGGLTGGLVVEFPVAIAFGFEVGDLGLEELRDLGAGFGGVGEEAAHMVEEGVFGGGGGRIGVVERGFWVVGRGFGGVVEGDFGVL
jgi:hypothetical protein